MEGLQIDVKKLSSGVLKWLVSALGFIVVSSVLAYLAKGLISTNTGLLTIAFLFSAGFLAFAVFLAIVFEPLEWLAKTAEPQGPTLERRLEEAKNSFLFDITELVMRASIPKLTPLILEFQKAHPNASQEETDQFWEQLRKDAAKGHIVPLDEDAVEELNLATDYIDTVSELRVLREHAHRQMRHFVYASAAYYPASILAAAVAAGFPFDIGSVIGIFYSGALMVLIFVRYGFGPSTRRLKWWRSVLERLKDKDSNGVKRIIEEMEPPPFPLRRHL
jgi:hypothetical protein